MTFAGQDNRLNNITVDGSYFNNSFGLSGAPGDRTGVAPISLEAIEQIQVNVAPVRRPPGQLHRRRRQHRHAQRNQPADRGPSITASAMRTSSARRRRDCRSIPGTFQFRDTGGWAAGPIVRNRLFVFGNYEDESDTRPLHDVHGEQRRADRSAAT